MFIAAWAIIIGLLQLWGAIEFRKELEDVWLLVLNGVLSIAFGVILFAQTGAGAVALVWMIGWFAVVFGCLYIALAFRLKKFKQTDARCSSICVTSSSRGASRDGQFRLDERSCRQDPSCPRRSRARRLRITLSVCQGGSMQVLFDHRPKTENG